MKDNLLILGCGGHGRVVADAASLSGLWGKIAFVDDIYPEVRVSGGYPLIGDSNTLSGLKERWPNVVVAFGKNKLRLHFLDKLGADGFKIVSIIHPSAQIAQDVVVGAGTVCFANCVVNSGSSLGRGVIVNTAATIDHDGKIADGVHLSPGVHLAGAVEIGRRSWVGIGASVTNNVFIGADVIIGAGGVVINDIPDSVTAVGLPAKPVVNSVT
ncbi:acetyltransferase [Aestuariirhabdus sp. LZHN29]|uniref:acetyltransferase n=1 Tax=Aestuariirhabdus sp. LZHN29 TaxID=3417462 RepID=UPI003CEF03C6